MKTTSLKCFRWCWSKRQWGHSRTTGTQRIKLTRRTGAVWSEVRPLGRTNCSGDAQIVYKGSYALHVAETNITDFKRLLITHAMYLWCHSSEWGLRLEKVLFNKTTERQFESWLDQHSGILKITEQKVLPLLYIWKWLPLTRRSSRIWIIKELLLWVWPHPCS